MSAPTVTAKQFSDTSQHLQAARRFYTDAQNDLLKAKHTLETRKAERLAEGVEGSNAEQREANLRLELAEAFDKVHRLEVALNEARCEVENAKTVWDLQRYRLRLAEIDAAELRRVA